MNCLRQLHKSSTFGSTLIQSAVKRNQKPYLRLTSLYSTAPLPKVDPNEKPISVSTPVGKDKDYDPKLKKIVDEIAKLTLLEVADLNELLKKTLNIPDTPVMSPMAMGSFAAAAGPPKEEEEVAQPKKVQTSFTLKLVKFDEAKKVALIKEIKNQLEGMNLVQAKKFVESAPTVVKADVAKEEAEKLKAVLEAAGASCEIA